LKLAYDIFEHVHRLAAWAASRAASTSKARFSVFEGQAVMTECGFTSILRKGLDGLPTPEEMDVTHRQWRTNMIETAERRGLFWSHGTVAKLINVYCKVAFVGLRGYEDARVGALHPPVDRILLSELIKKDPVNKTQWRCLRDRGWSNFDSSDYEVAIAGIRKALGVGAPLWQIEQWWQGYQDDTK
jgi:hypothetical protein